jgi:AcrR family transcriptional regulator
MRPGQPGRVERFDTEPAGCRVIYEPMTRSPRRRNTSTDRTPAAPESTIKLSYAEKVRALLRESLMDAAAGALARNSWSATRMVDIAAAVGVSRQTVYNEFGNKDELGRALLLRESGKFLNQVEAALDLHPGDPVSGLVASIEVFLRLTQQEPLLRAIIGGADPNHSDLSPLLSDQGAAVLPFITGRLSDRFLSQWPDADRAGVEVYSASVVRLAISHVVFPVAEPAVTAADIGRVFAPYLNELTAGAEGEPQSRPAAKFQ